MASTKKVRADQLVVGMVLTPGLGGGSTRSGIGERAVVVKVEVGGEEGRRVGVHTAAESDGGLWAYQCATPGYLYTVEEG